MRVFTILVMKPRVMPMKMALRILNRLPGIRGMSVTLPTVTPAFATVPHAEKAREALFASGWRVGKYIMNADVDLERKRIDVKDPVGGWDSVDPMDMERDADGQPEHLWDYLASKKDRKKEGRTCTED